MRRTCSVWLCLRKKTRRNGCTVLKKVCETREDNINYNASVGAPYEDPVLLISGGESVLLFRGK